MEWFRAQGNEHYMLSDFPENLNCLFSAAHVFRESSNEPYRYIVHGKTFGGLSGKLEAKNDRDAKAEVLVKIEEHLQRAIAEIHERI